jgi:hypothetical protein
MAADQLSYWKEFKEVLDGVAAQALSDDPSVRMMAYLSLYQPRELAEAAWAAWEVGMKPAQGVLAFIISSAAANSEAEKRGSLFGRFKARRVPLPGTPSFRHLEMVNYATATLSDPDWDRDLAGRFLDRFAQRLNAS